MAADSSDDDDNETGRVHYCDAHRAHSYCATVIRVDSELARALYPFVVVVVVVEPTVSHRTYPSTHWSKPLVRCWLTNALQRSLAKLSSRSIYWPRARIRLDVYLSVAGKPKSCFGPIR